MIRTAFFIFLVFLTAAVPALAEKYSRAVNLELDQVDGATSYQIEIKSLDDGKTIKTKLRQPLWTGRLTVGAYRMRVRAFDYRGVPGDWSQPEKFDVGLEKVKLGQPAAGAKLSSKNDSMNVRFEWHPIGAAKTYDVVIESRDHEYNKQTTVSGGSFVADLPVGKDYVWKVIAHGPAGLQSEAAGDFQIVGLLQKPVMTPPKSPFVRELQWSDTNPTKDYSVRLLRFDHKSRRWQVMHKADHQTENKLAFDPNWPGGVYRLKVQATGDKFKPSDVSSVTFRVRDGNRSGDAEYEFTIRDAIDRSNGWFMFGSYKLTSIAYSSVNNDGTAPAATAFTGIGGTVTLGAGYLTKEGTYGFNGMISDAGFIRNGQTTPTLYNSAEANVVHRDKMGSSSEFREYGGLFYHEDPVVLGNAVTLQIDGVANAVFVGPHLGIEYLMALTPRLAFNPLAHLYYGLLKLKSPNGQTASSPLTTEYGLRASYVLTPRVAGTVGVIHRGVSFTYGSVSPGKDANSVSYQENSVNLMLDYNF